MLPLDQLNARRIAFIKPSALGDIVHALPVLTAVRVRFPAARITWVVNSAFEPLIRDHPDLTDTLPFDRDAFRRSRWHSVRYALAFARELRRRQFDLVFDLQGLFRTGLMCLATGSTRLVGFTSAREGSRYVYTDKIHTPNSRKMHAVDRYWALAEALGVGDLPKRFHVPVDPIDKAAIETELAGLPRPWLAVAVGAKWITKRWLPGHFAEILRRSQSHFGGTCLFIGSREDTALSQEVMRSLSGQTRDLTARTTLPRLAALLSQCDAMVGNDTGPLHLAAALGLPCVAPYSCTRVALHGPYTSMRGGVETNVPCGGSYRKTCPDMICMSELLPDRLWPRLAEILNAWTLRQIPYHSA
ncbi:MAG TPA: glycosyltransferase family 9 protein [Gemmata sp.]|jgi:heptosyltransferase-1|nr:glycosyltransferase family 9 protein [Gemmata sp.]